MKLLRFRTYCITLVFLAMISFPLINSKLHFLLDTASFENRAMANEPIFDIRRLDSFPARYERFYNDHFELRNRSIRYFNLYNVKLYRKSPLASVVIGRDNWLYAVGEEMDSYTGKNKLTSKELLDFKLELEYRKKYLEERGIRFYFMIVPCKASIHTSYIGYEYFRMSRESWGEQLNHYLEQNSSIRPVDIFSMLREHAKKENVFYKLDNHWNGLGAFYSANAIFQRMHQDFPSVHPLSLDDYQVVNTETPAGNLERMMGNLGIFSESSTELKPKIPFKAHNGPKAGYPPIPGFAYPWDYELVKEIDGSHQPELLIICDSFGDNIFLFLAENFRKTVKIFDDWRYRLNENIVNQEKPDAVLLMINEPILRKLLNFQSRPGTK